MPPKKNVQQILFKIENMEHWNQIVCEENRKLVGKLVERITCFDSDRLASSLVWSV